MPERETLSGILRRWNGIRQSWDDRASARLLDTCLKPLTDQTRLLEEQQAEIARFVTLTEAALEELEHQF